MDNLFELPALERLSKIIANHFTGRGITDLFKKSNFQGIIHDGSTKWEFLYSTLQDIQKKDNNYNNILKFLLTASNPQEYFEKQESHQKIINEINKVLSFYKLNLTKQGKLNTTDEKQDSFKEEETPDSELFHKRSYHSEIVKHGHEQFIQGHYFDAVDECCKAFTKYVSNKSDLDLHGSKLMSSALSQNGSLKLNSHKTETERNLQDGLMHMSIGLMKGIRNSVEHEPQLDFTINSQDALDILSLISYLYRQIDKTTLDPMRI